MKALVTGGAGFIGSNLVDGLLQAGHQVVVLDDLSTGQMGNLEYTLDRIQFVQGSVLSGDLLLSCAEGCSAIFHCAAIASVARSVADPVAVERVNVEGTLHALEAARNVGAKLILSSSAAVYGTLEEQAAEESMPISPTSPYGAQKAACEAYALAYHRTFGVPTLSLRYFNVYGNRQNPEGEYAAVVPKFLDQAHGGHPLTVFGDGEQTRDFISVEDVVEANLLAVQSSVCDGRALNVCSGEETSIRQLAQWCIEAAESQSEIRYEVARAGEIRHSKGMPNRAFADLRFSASTPLAAGLKNLAITYAYSHLRDAYHHSG